MKKYIILFIVISAFSFINDVERNIPNKNIKFIKFIEHNGKTIAPSYKKANCVQFMDELLKQYIDINKSTSKRIYINIDMNRVETLINKNDSTIVAGVCWALVTSKKAKWINPSEVKRGDIVQYWSSEGFINGHCGIIYSEDKDGYIIYSSHPDSKGFGKINVMNKTMKNVKFYFVRLI